MHSDDLFETVSSRHGELTFFANDTGAITESLRRYGEWAENELSFMLSMVREGDTVIDVGGYIGTHSLAFAQHVGAAGSVISIEAQSSSFEVLTRNIAANGLKNVHLEHAVASATAKDELIPAIDIELPGSFGSASLRDVLVPGVHREAQEGGAGNQKGLAVRSVAVDDLSVSSCALIKIDVEGMEDMVLRGAAQTIRRFQPAIYAECNSLEDGLRTFTVLKEFGYRVRAHVVLAYNADNFRLNPENIFGGAREIAIVGTPKTEADPLQAYVPRACELLLDIETVDDLALALLNKPQYEHEVLRSSAAGRSGGQMCLDEVRTLRSAHDELTRSYEARTRSYEEATRTIETLRVEFQRQLQDFRLEADRRAAAADEESRNLRAEVGRVLELEQASLAREDALQATLLEMQRSTSWRVTAPLRALKKVMSRP